MKRNTPIKTKIYKTDLYQKHERLILKLANTYTKATKMEFEDLRSEFNIIFCEAVRKYKPQKSCFSTFLVTCCRNHAMNIIRKNQLKRNTGIVINKLFIDEDELNIYEYLSDGIDILEKFIVYDDLHNNENPIIKSITKIISTYKLPETGLKTWIKSLLLNKGYKHQEIANSLRILKTLY